MTNSRSRYSEIEKRLLFAQVEGFCPLCGDPLTYSKNGKSSNGYELAHIYPLNPTPEEFNLLENEEKLSDDVNDLKNILPLCRNCHNKYDNPRTIEEYRHLVDVKKKIIERDKVKRQYPKYYISREIMDIINALYQIDLVEKETKLDYIALNLDKKLKKDFDKLLKRKIENNITDYFNYIQKLFKNMEKSSPGRSNIIASQIKTFYLELKSEISDQKEIFYYMADWLHKKTSCGSDESCQVIIAYFIQNCEVFEFVAE